MSYSNIFLRGNSKKVPTAIFLIVIMSISILLVRLFSTKPVTSRATKKNLRQMKIVNLSYNHAGIFWQTETKERGWIVYGNKQAKLDQIALDDRDTAEKKTAYINHYASIKNIEQNKDFYFKIVSNDSLIADISGKPFYFQTPSNIAGSTNISPAYGKVVSANGSPLSTGLVILSFRNSYPLLNTLKLSGEWLIPLNNLIDKTSEKVRNLENGEIGLIEIYSEEGQKSSIEVIAENLSPLPQTIVMGQNYSFISKENVLSATSSSNGVPAKEIAIIFPKDEGIIPGESPLIKGTALPGSEVIVIINSQISYSARVKADEDGVWRLVPKERLPAGRHTLTMITKNKNGEEIKLVRQFTIAKSGEQVLGDATPEPTLTLIPSTQPTSAVPTTGLTATPTPPTSGFSPVPMTIISGGMMIIGLGIILAF